MEENSTAAFQKGPHTLNPEPEAKENKKSPPKPVRYKKPIRAAVKWAGTTQMGFVLPHLRTTVLCTSILSISYK